MMMSLNSITNWIGEIELPIAMATFQLLTPFCEATNCKVYVQVAEVPGTQIRQACVGQNFVCVPCCATSHAGLSSPSSKLLTCHCWVLLYCPSEPGFWCLSIDLLKKCGHANWPLPHWWISRCYHLPPASSLPEKPLVVIRHCTV